MKKFQFFGLLVIVVLLAFGLSVGCDNGTTSNDNAQSDPVTYTATTADGKEVVITFDTVAIEARARAAEPRQGDKYQIKVANSVVSKGTIELLGGGNIKFIDDQGAEFNGQLTNSELTVSNIPNPGGTPLSVTATSGVTSPGSTSPGTSPGATRPPAVPGGMESGTAGFVKVVNLFFTNDRHADGTHIGGGLGNDNLDDTLIVVFNIGVDSLNLTNVAIESIDGAAALDMKGMVFGQDENKTWIIPLDATKTKTGLVKVSITKAGIEDTKRTVVIQGAATLAPVLGLSTPAPILVQSDLATQLTTGYWVDTPMGIRFNSTVTAIQNTFTEKDITVNMLNGPFGETSLKTASLIKNPAGTYILPIESVGVQGPIEVIIQKEGYLPIVSELVVTQKGFIPVNSITAVPSGSTTTKIRVEFEYPPETLPVALTGASLVRGLNYGETGDLASKGNPITDATVVPIDSFVYEWTIPADAVTIAGDVNFYVKQDYVGLPRPYVSDLSVAITDSEIDANTFVVPVVKPAPATLLSYTVYPATGATESVTLTFDKPVYGIVSPPTLLHNGAASGEVTALVNPSGGNRVNFTDYTFDLQGIPNNRRTLVIQFGDQEGISDDVYRITVNGINPADTAIAIPTPPTITITSTPANLTTFNKAANDALPAASRITAATLTAAGGDTYNWWLVTVDRPIFGGVTTSGATLDIFTNDINKNDSDNQTYYFYCKATTAVNNNGEVAWNYAVYPVQVSGKLNW